MHRNFILFASVFIFSPLLGCLAKSGITVPLRGRTRMSYTGGAELQIPFAYPDDKLGGMVAYSYTEFRSPVEHSASLSRGTVNHANLGMEMRLLIGLPEYIRLHPEKIINEKGQEVEPEISEEVWSPLSTHSWFWVGFGPEYHWNSFTVSGRDLSRAVVNNIFYDEHVRNSWGGRVSIGIGGRFFGAGHIELSYHWAHTSTVTKGTSGGVLFRRTREDPMEWLSLCLAVGF